MPGAIITVQKLGFDGAFVIVRQCGNYEYVSFAFPNAHIDFAFRPEIREDIFCLLLKMGLIIHPLLISIVLAN